MCSRARSPCFVFSAKVSSRTGSATTRHVRVALLCTNVVHTVVNYKITGSWAPHFVRCQQEPLQRAIRVLAFIPIAVVTGAGWPLAIRATPPPVNSLFSFQDSHWWCGGEETRVIIGLELKFIVIPINHENRHVLYSIDGVSFLSISCWQFQQSARDYMPSAYIYLVHPPGYSYNLLLSVFVFCVFSTSKGCTLLHDAGFLSELRLISEMAMMRGSRHDAPHDVYV